MSVYKPAKSRFWHYDFVFKGSRHHGSTGQETRRKALAVEAARREAIGLAAARSPSGRDPPERPINIPTLDVAAAEWWDFKGRSLDRPETEDQRLARLSVAVNLVGAQLLVNEIRTTDIATAIKKRRGKLVRGKTVPSNATVNREVIDIIRPVIRRACKLLDISPPPIDWGEVRLQEKKPKPREFRDADLDRVVDALPIWWRDFARFASRYGCRLEEMFFTPADIDVEGRRLRLRDRKGGDDHTLPLMPDDLAMLSARKGRAEAAGLPTVWFRELKTGRLSGLTYNGAKQAMRTAMTVTGLRASQGAKGAHDFRRHAAIRILRSSNNLKMTQKLLGHADIKSTLIYADVVEDDLRAGLEALSRNSPEAASASTDNA